MGLPVARRSVRPPLNWCSMPRQRSSSSSPANPPGIVEDSIPSVSPARVMARVCSTSSLHDGPARPKPRRWGWNGRLCTYAILRAAMKTSLAQRERRRRNGTGAHRPGGGPGRRVAVMLPLFLLATFFVLSTVAFVGAVQIYHSYSADLEDPKQALADIPYKQQTVLLDRTGTVQLAAFG